jgi:hypothetical protein
MQKGSSSIVRRQFLISLAASMLSAPAVVRVASLMSMRGVIYPIERHCFGFVDRLFVHGNLPTIRALQNAGLSAHEIAARMNVRHMTAMNGRAWDAQAVMGIIRRDQLIAARI